MIAARPSRTMIWSSASNTRIGAAFDPSLRVDCSFFLLAMANLISGLRCGQMFQRDQNFGGPSQIRRYKEATAHLFNPFSHADQPEAIMVGMGIESPAVINQL